MTNLSEIQGMMKHIEIEYVHCYFYLFL